MLLLLLTGTSTIAPAAYYRLTLAAAKPTSMVLGTRP